VHALVTEGVVTAEGTFIPLLAPDLEAVCEVFRRLVLAGLRRAERLSDEFHERLLAWSPSGFSVHGAQVAHADEPDRLERLARYVTRAPWALDRVIEGGEGDKDDARLGGGAGDRDGDGAHGEGTGDCADDGGARGDGGDGGQDGVLRGGPRQAGSAARVRVLTPPDPSSGRTVLELDALEFVHRVTTQIPDPRRHLVRYYGAYASRTRGALRSRRQAAAAATATLPGQTAGLPGQSLPGQPAATGQAAAPCEPAQPASPSRANWARLLRRIFEVDPLLCPRCGASLAVVAVLTDPKVVDRILRHLTERGLATSVHARGPPSDATDPSADPSAA
jgi:hypothetical protein